MDSKHIYLSLTLGRKDKCTARVLYLMEILSNFNDKVTRKMVIKNVTAAK